MYGLEDVASFWGSGVIGGADDMAVVASGDPTLCMACASWTRALWSKRSRKERGGFSWLRLLESAEGSISR